VLDRKTCCDYLRDCSLYKDFVITKLFTKLITIITTRDVNFGFFQKSIIVLKKWFFFDYQIWASLTAGRTKTCWDAVTDAGTVVACPPGVALPLATATAGNNPGSRIRQVLPRSRHRITLANWLIRGPLTSRHASRECAFICSDCVKLFILHTKYIPTKTILCLLLICFS